MSAPSDIQPTHPGEQERLVLIVEDDAPIAEALAMIVEDLGYTPLVATDGLAGLNLARRRQPRLILTAQGKLVPPIVVVTATGRQLARAVGGDAIIPKPFELEQVKATLRRVPSPPATLTLEASLEDIVRLGVLLSSGSDTWTASELLALFREMQPRALQLSVALRAPDATSEGAIYEVGSQGEVITDAPLFRIERPRPGGTATREA
jgi:CheY-like chemotaxis protein